MLLILLNLSGVLQPNLLGLASRWFRWVVWSIAGENVGTHSSTYWNFL